MDAAHGHQDVEQAELLVAVGRCSRAHRRSVQQEGRRRRNDRRHDHRGHGRTRRPATPRATATTDETVAPVPAATDPPVTEPTTKSVTAARSREPARPRWPTRGHPPRCSATRTASSVPVSFYDPLVAIDDDLKGARTWPRASRQRRRHGVDDQAPQGISFTDGTPLNADAVIENLQTSRYRPADPAPSRTRSRPRHGAARWRAATTDEVRLKIEKVDDMTFTMFTGKDGDRASRSRGRASPSTSPASSASSPRPRGSPPSTPSTAQADQPVGTGPFIVAELRTREGGKLVVTKNPDYWQKDADGMQLPYLDKIAFKVIEDRKSAPSALRAATSTSSRPPTARHQPTSRRRRTSR